MGGKIRKINVFNFNSINGSDFQFIIGRRMSIRFSPYLENMPRVSEQPRRIIMCTTADRTKNGRLLNVYRTTLSVFVRETIFISRWYFRFIDRWSTRENSIQLQSEIVFKIRQRRRANVRARAKFRGVFFFFDDKYGSPRRGESHWQFYIASDKWISFKSTPVLIEFFFNFFTVFQSSPSGDGRHASREVIVVVRHAYGHDVQVVADGRLELQQCYVVLERGRVVLTVHDHAFHVLADAPLGLHLAADVVLAEHGHEISQKSARDRENVVSINCLRARNSGQR